MRAALLALAAGACPGAAAALDPPAGATVAFEASEPLGSARLATGPWDGGGVPALTLEGEVARAAWQVPGAATTLQLLAPLRDALVADGFDVLLDCDAEACGGFDFRRGVEVLPAPAMFVDLADFRYLAARKEGAAVSLLVSRSGATGFVQAIEVAGARPAPDRAPGPMSGPAADGAADAAPGPAAAAAADLGARLDADGHAVIAGLRFASGSADSEGGEEALAALAAWLAADPSRRVAVVGHTDATGALAANVALSRRRAEAVARRLSDEFGVGSSRVVAEGAGWLSPVASNLTPEGRDANRRVEAVALP